MANEEHLAILRKALDEGDIEIWNDWRKENPDIQPDLSEMNLSYVDLREIDLNNTVLRSVELVEVNLTNANLGQSHLIEARLWGAKLWGAYLGGTNLAGANLTGSHLWYANLTGANLAGVRLNNVVLRGSNLNNTTLEATDFEDANCNFAIFANVDLSQAINLDKVKHEGLSTIGIDTLYKSKGNIPDEFLIGCGMPKSIVELAHKLQEREGFRLFISHSRDLDFCKKLAEYLRNSDFYTFFDDDSMQGGNDTTKQLQSNIMSADKVIVVVSEYSMNSEWVREEIRLAAKREREENRNIIFPIRLVTYPAMNNWSIPDIDAGINNVADLIRSRTIPDFQDWRDASAFKQAFEKLLADLQGNND